MRYVILYVALALSLLCATPVAAQRNCETLGTCPRPTPAPRAPAPPPAQPAQPRTPRVDPCAALWRTTSATGTIAAYEDFVRRCPRHANAGQARSRAADLRCDASWQEAARLNTSDAYERYLNACPQRENATARSRLAELRCDESWRTVYQEQTLSGWDRFALDCPSHSEAAAALSRAAHLRSAPWNVAGLPADSVPIPRAGLSAEAQREAANCEAGNPSACFSIGVMFRRGLGAPQSNLWSAALYGRSCARNDAEGCGLLGFMVHQGLIGRQDFPLVAALWSRACNGDDWTSCTNLGTLFSNAQGVERNYQTAADLFERGCNQGNIGGNAAGCRNAADIYAAGTGPVRADRVRALRLAEMGLRREPTNAELIAMRDRLRQ